MLVFERGYRLSFPPDDPLGGLCEEFLTSRGEGNTGALLKLGNNGLSHNPRHPDRWLVQLKMAGVLAQSQTRREAAALYDSLSKMGVELPAFDMLRYADVLARLHRRSRP